MDFSTINPELGSWEEVVAIGDDFQLMFDYVVNHFSSKGQWFENYLAGKEGYVDFAMEVDPSTDLSQVTRPRALPLLSEYKKHDGSTVHLWTTFSADQIDFNFRSLDVLEKMIEVLLLYAQKGATILRLDAIAYLWKEIGTTCIHLSETHDMVKLFRSILDLVAPLLFYSFLKENGTVLTNWAKGLHLESASNTFFNFTASHDGIGVRPLEGILPPEEIDALAEVVKANGGQVSYKRNPDGSDSPYELNITYVDAILADSESTQAEKFLASQAIQYVLPGVPATYIHSLLGSRNWLEGVKQTGRARTINRAKLAVENLMSELKDPESFRARIFYSYIDLIKIRKKQQAFHPNADFEILEIDPKVFAIKRYSQEQTIYALTNISSKDLSVSLSGDEVAAQMTDLITEEKISTGSITLKPYQYMWLH
jgi:sucrose phosphorylase